MKTRCLAAFAMFTALAAMAGAPVHLARQTVKKAPPPPPTFPPPEN